MRLEIITVGLPEGFDALNCAARAEGSRILDRLASEWASGATRFDRPGERLLAALVGRAIVGSGGLTLDPVTPGAVRMRRFYIHPLWRGRGVGRMIATALLEHARLSPCEIMVNAATRDATAFWRQLGFQPDLRDGHTHRLPSRRS